MTLDHGGGYLYIIDGFFFEIRSYVAQVGLNLNVVKDVLHLLLSSCFHLLHAGIPGVSHRAGPREAMWFFFKCKLLGTIQIAEWFAAVFHHCILDQVLMQTG